MRGKHVNSHRSGETAGTYPPRLDDLMVAVQSALYLDQLLEVILRQDMRDRLEQSNNMYTELHYITISHNIIQGVLNGSHPLFHDVIGMAGHLLHYAKCSCVDK